MRANEHLTMPAGHHYVLTRGLPVEFVGMSAALLHRSRCFVELTGSPVTILTYTPDDYDNLRTELTRRDYLVDGLTVLNLFDDLRTWDDERLRAMLPSAAQVTPGVVRLSADHPDVRDVAHARVRTDRPLRLSREERLARIAQRDHLRADGSIVVLERFRLGGPEGFQFTVCDSDSRPLHTFGSRGEAVQFWLDSLPRDPIAWVVADNIDMARHLVDYHRPDVVTIHVVHSNHIDVLKKGTGVPRERSAVLKNLDSFDAGVFLTESQLTHLAGLIGPGRGNRYVISNPCRVPDALPTGRRNRRRGVQIGSLINRKRIDNGIKAVALAGDVIDPRSRPHLDVYGKGDREGDLRTCIDEVRRWPRSVLRARLARLLGQRIGDRLAQIVERRNRPPATLRGYSSHAREEFASASFSLLTSRDEAFGLVLVESMGRGCIPISYDIRFGPNEIITPGVNGFLVKPLDNVAMAKAIRRVVTMDKAERQRMRVAAHRRALDFTAEPITRQWIAMMGDILAERTRAAHRVG